MIDNLLIVFLSLGDLVLFFVVWDVVSGIISEIKWKIRYNKIIKDNNK